MRLAVEKTERLEGAVTAPPSKSHTHRAMIIASLAYGESVIRNASNCDDCLTTLECCRKFGIKAEAQEALRIAGVDGRPRRPDSDIDVGSSGTTMRLMTAIYALCQGATVLTGDESVRARPMAPLLKSLADLGAKRARSMGSDGCPPVCVTGRMTGGKTTIDGQSSQFVSALLMTCPLTELDSEISVQNLNSKPYVAMTLEHMKRGRVGAFHSTLDRFFIPGSQAYRPIDYTVPGDYSAAAFLKVAEAITDSKIGISGLDPDDVQGDRVIGDFIELMRTGKQREIDLRKTPDLLPALAVMACRAEGSTAFINVRHARAKESDRITAISSELRKMGAAIEEREDGITVHNSQLKGAEVEGHRDHRIVMALAVAGLIAEGRTIINGADAISKSYPGFANDMRELGANIRAVE